MSDILKDINSEEFQKKLLQAWIASRIAYNDELVSEGHSPEIKDYEKNYSKFDHEIEKIIASKDYAKKSEFRNLSTKILSKHVICECLNKRLIIALTIIKPENKEKENNFVADFFGSIEDSSSSTNFEYNELNSINKCIRYHGSLIPIDHLIDKLIDGYELVFTGYSFGAALAAFLAIRVLLTKRNYVDIDDLNRVSFIGFGCPLFVNETFQKFIKNKQHEDKFYFYRHENDFNVYFVDLNTAILKRLGISSEAEDMKLMKAKLNELILSVFYHPFELSEENRELFLNYLKTECLNFSDSEFKQKPFVRFGHNLTISSTGNKIKLNEVENDCNYYNIEILKSKIESIKSYNLKINDYFNDYFDVSVEQNDKSISYLEEFKIGRTFEYLFYPDYSIRYKNNHEITDRIINENTDQNEHFTMNIIQYSYSDVFLGIYNSKRKYLKTVIGIFMYISNDLGLIYSDYKESYKTIWYTFKPMKELTGEMKFILYTLYEEIAIKPPANITEIVLKERGNFKDKKKICTYEMTLDLLYIHAFFFIYIVKKSKKEIAGKISDNCFKIIKNYDKLNQELIQLIQLDGISLNSLEAVSKKEYIKKFFEQFKTVSHMKSKLFEYLPNFFNLKLALVNLVKNPKLLWTCLANVSNKYNELEIFESFRKAMWYFKIDQEADLKYIYAVKELEKELEKKISIDTNQSEPFSFNEEIIRNNREILENQDMEEVFLNKSKFLNSVVSNFNIREALVDSCLIGIEGEKKAGKSTFVDFILKERRNLGSASKETKEMSAYRFSEDIEMLLVDYPNYDSKDEFYALQFEYSKYILDYAFVVCDAMLIGDTMTLDLLNVFAALNALGVNRYCVIMNKFDQLIGEIERRSSDFLANEINKFLCEKKNLIISKLEDYDRRKYFQPNREELEKNLLIIPTCLTLNESSHPEILFKCQKAGILFGENLKEKLLKTIADNIENEHVKSNLKIYYEKEKIIKKCIFITKLKKRYGPVLQIDIKKEDRYDEIKKNIKESFEGIGDSFCIKSELSDSNSDLITSIDGFFNNKGFVFIVEKNNEKECAFELKQHPELKSLGVNINKDITFNDLQGKINDHFKLERLTTFWIKPQISLLYSSESITSIDGFFNSKGFDFIVEIYKECSFEMKHHPEPLKVTINEDISFDELQRRIKEHFRLEELETFWIKPNPSETINSIDGLFKSKESNFIVEIYKECVFEMKQHSEFNCFIQTINKDISFDKLQFIIRKNFNLESLARFSIKPKKLNTEPYSSGSSITSIDEFFKSKWFTFIVDIVEIKK